MSYKIKIFYSNNMKKHDDSSRFLQQALKRCGAPVYINGSGDSALNIARPARGRPYAPDAPWLQFSVTHTGSMWICAAASPTPHPKQPLPHPPQAAAANTPPVGLDAEYADRRILHPKKIAEKYFSEKEKQYLQEAGAASGRARFIKIWTMKEAYLKMLGTGITDDAENSCVLTAPDAWFVTGEPLARLEKELSAAAGQQMVLSLCFAAGRADAPQKDTEPELEILQLY